MITWMKANERVVSYTGAADEGAEGVTRGDDDDGARVPSPGVLRGLESPAKADERAQERGGESEEGDEGGVVEVEVADEHLVEGDERHGGGHLEERAADGEGELDPARGGGDGTAHDRRRVRWRERSRASRRFRIPERAVGERALPGVV